ncbi:hypothetical protein AWENTII_000048 [Aspergillus wentii]
MEKLLSILLLLVLPVLPGILLYLQTPKPSCHPPLCTTCQKKISRSARTARYPQDQDALICRMPIEVILHIAQMLPPDSTAAMALTCRSMLDILWEYSLEANKKHGCSF